MTIKTMKNILILFLSFFSLTSYSQTYSTQKKVKNDKEYLVFTFENDTDTTFTRITIKSTYSNGKYSIPKSLTFDINLHPGDKFEGDLFDNHTYLRVQSNGGYVLKKYDVIFHPIKKIRYE